MIMTLHGLTQNWLLVGISHPTKKSRSRDIPKVKNSGDFVKVPGIKIPRLKKSRIPGIKIPRLKKKSRRSENRKNARFFKDISNFR